MKSIDGSTESFNNVLLNGVINATSKSLVVRNPSDRNAIARGLVSGVSYVSLFGQNLNVGTTTAVVSSVGVYQTPSTSKSLEILSSSTDDTLLGTGARTVLVEGLDSDFNIQTEIVELNGTTAVALVNQYIRVLSINVNTSGNYSLIPAPAMSHLGTITLQESGGGTWLEIPLVNSTAMGKSMVGAYTVPAGHSFFITDLNLCSASTTGSIILVKRTNADITSAPHSAVEVIQIYARLDKSNPVPNLTIPIIEEKTDIVALAYATLANQEFSINIGGYLFTN